MTTFTGNLPTPRDEAVLSVPLNRHFGLVFDGRHEGCARTHFMVTDNLMALGGLHAGVLYSLLDATCMLALLPFLQDGQHAVTHDIHVAVMRPSTAGARCDLVGRILKVGRTLAFLEAQAEIDGSVVAAARVTKTLAA